MPPKNWHYLVNWLESMGIIGVQSGCSLMVAYPPKDGRPHSPSLRHSASHETSGNMGLGPWRESAHSQGSTTLAPFVRLSLVTMLRKRNTLIAKHIDKFSENGRCNRISGLRE